MSKKTPTVAVIGLGGMGLVAVKNLLEEGFDVTGFEKSGYVGGVWHYTEDENTLSVLKGTRANVTVDRGSYTDFPFPKGTPPYCSAKTFEEYIESYVEHFRLSPHLQLNTAVRRVTLEESSRRWRVEFEGGAAPKHFDKVVVATGPHVRPMLPTLEGEQHFQGSITHSIAFKRPEVFEGKKVVVLGLGNTGGDVVDALTKVASSVYVAHNNGAVILPRVIDGKPASRLVTQRGINVQGLLEKHVPSWMEKVVNKKVEGIMEDCFGHLDPSWRLSPGPSIKVSPPVVSDTLVEHLRTGRVKSVRGIRGITGPSTVELEDGEVLDGVDAIVCCTGYRNDFSLLDRSVDPSSDPPSSWSEAPGSRGRPLPRLYRNVFSLEAPESLAFLGCAWFPAGALMVADLASMCIAQVWRGKSTLPSREDMSRWVDGQTERMVGLAHKGTPVVASVPQLEWLHWADEVAGTGMFERLGWGVKGWSFWAADRELYRLIMDGVLTSASWRLFDEGKRKPWPGAREEIVRLNQEA